MEVMWEKYRRNRDSEARNALVMRYVPLVRMLAQKVKATLPPCVEHGDLENAGVLGLMGAIDKYDESRGTTFETFCSQRIHYAMIDHLREQDFLPRMLRLKLHKLDRFRNRMANELGRQPTDSELAEEMGITPGKVRKLKRDQNVSLVSLDSCAENRDNDETRRQKVWEDRTTATPLQSLEKQELREVIDNALGRTEKVIVTLYYYEKLTMRQIGEVIGLSEARVSQIHRKVMQDLRKRFAVS